MKLDVIEEVAGVRVATYSWQSPDGTTGENKLFASVDGSAWREIEAYSPVHTLSGVTDLTVRWVR